MGTPKPDAFRAEAQDHLYDSDAGLQLQDDLQQAHDHNDTVRRSSHKRKHSRIYSAQESLTSGRFDDAEEEITLRPHDSKRRRSEDHNPQESWLDDEINHRPGHTSKTSELDDPTHDPPISPRSSKFIEGSMNDRVSTKPPSPYLGTEEAMNNYHNSESHLGRIAHQRNKSITHDHTTNNNRSSGFFRFGKAVVSAFNPVTAWGSLSDMWKGQHESANGAKNPKKEEQLKIEEAYAKLKKSGYKGTRSTIHVDRLQRDEGERTNIFDMPRPTTYHPEHVFDDQKAPKEQKRYGRIFQGDEGLLPNLDTRGRSSTRDLSREVSDRESSSKPSFHTRRPSMQDLHKVTSYLQLPSAKRRRSASPAVFDAEQGVPTSRELAALQTDAQKFLKKEDIRKQKKLSKQVSDLEVKLERARQELQAVMGAPPPVPDHNAEVRGRKMFVPGALPSLPSERLLNQHLGQSQEDDDDFVSATESTLEGKGSTFTKTITVDSNSSATPQPTHSRVHFQADEESPGPTPPAKDSPKTATPKKPASRRAITKKRKIKYDTDGYDDKDGEYRPSGRDTSTDKYDEDDELSASSHGAPPKKLRKPSKLNKMSMVNSPGSAEKKQRTQPKRSSIYASRDASRTKSTPDLPSKIPRSDNSAPGRPRRPTTSSAKHGQKPSLGPRNRQGRRSISPYPYSSPERGRESPGVQPDYPITVVPGADTDGGTGEKVPPVPPIPKELKIMSGSENVSKARPAKGKIVVDEGKGGKTAQQKMHEKGKMSISGAQTEEKFEWPADVF